MQIQFNWPGAAALALFVVLAAGGCSGNKVASGNVDGAELFATACARCHGPAGAPEAARAAQLGVRDLTSPEFQRSLSDEDIHERIMRGSMNRRMPSFASKLSEAQVDALVGYVRSLGAK